MMTIFYARKIFGYKNPFRWK